MRERKFGSGFSFRKKRNFGGGSFRNRGNHSSGGDVSRYIKKAEVKNAFEEYIPKHQFSDFEICPELKQNIINKGFIKPTSIQDQAIPAVLQGNDLIGVANTGTGKTASFLIPLINKVVKDRNEKVLIVVPTRELALQIVDEFITFSRSLNLYAATCIGGSNIDRQIISLKRKPNFVVGTPGRLMDLIQRKFFKPAQFTNVVLDEVDRMLDMGFVEDIKYLVSLLPEKRQTLFFSATISRNIETLMMDFLNNPVKISVKSAATAENIDQDIVRVNNKEKKIDVLHDLLIQNEFKKVLIFGRTKRGVEDLSNTLHERGFKVGAIHGDKTQMKREKVLNLFKANRIQTLVATDVAARGLDITDITHVINYDLPSTYEDYIHRIGRTGRANKTGKALTFVN